MVIDSIEQLSPFIFAMGMQALKINYLWDSLESDNDKVNEIIAQVASKIKSIHTSFHSYVTHVRSRQCGEGWNTAT